MAEIEAAYEKLSELKPKVCSSLEEIQELDIACKSVIQRYLNNVESVSTSSIIKVQAIMDYMYEQVNIGDWKEVRLFLRKTITIASYLKLLLYLNCSKELLEDKVKEAFKIIDFGLMFGCPLEKESMLLQNCAAILSPLHKVSDIAEKIVKSVDTINIENSSSALKVEVLDRPTMEDFYENYILKETPVVLDNCISHWPALTKWKDQRYFVKLAGLRTVSVEMGRDYTDSDWTQKLMTIEEFIKNHIYETDGPTGYLAQYQLFDQIPELRNDIIQPEYCCFAETDNPVEVMSWYGPKGTVSPLHHDSKKNLLAQVIGEKQLFLFSPKDSEYLYAHEHTLLHNTARIDPRKPDLEKYPDYRKAKPYFCVLRPGQILYIPPKWWHFVESLSISFSVSFWWE